MTDDSSQNKKIKDLIWCLKQDFYGTAVFLHYSRLCSLCVLLPNNCLFDVKKNGGMILNCNCKHHK